MKQQRIAETEYATKFGRSAVEGDYVAKVALEEVPWQRGFIRPVVHIGKIYKGFAYFSALPRTFAANKSAEFINVVNLEDVPELVVKSIADAIARYEKSREEKPERYFKIQILKIYTQYRKTIDSNTIIYSKTTTLGKDAKIEDIEKWARKVAGYSCNLGVHDPTRHKIIVQFEEILDEAKFLEQKRDFDKTDISSDVSIEIR